MKICYLDAFSGLSGDMTVGALIDAGADAKALFEALGALGTGAEFSVEKTRRRGIEASKFRVAGGDGKTHRHLSHIVKMIDAAPLPARAAARAKQVFERLGAAEAKVHGVPVEKVHFHEVGAVDSICDIVGACVALDLLGVEALYCSAVNVGSGTVNTEHGVMPVPTPATAELLIGRPVYSRGPAVELTTPTGAAIATTLAAGFGPMPPMSILSAGYGAGDKDFAEHANVLRATIGEATQAAESTTISVIEANIDDTTPEVLGYAMERLLASGALDVTIEPVLMKKNRPGHLLRVLSTPALQEALAGLIFAETSTLGLRIYPAERRVKARRIEEVETGYGRARIKISEDGSFAPEYEDCRRLAEEGRVPLRRVMEAASFAYLKTTK
jgi:pyridinium-3,5-bisthiocarboxylic acid mononucleotide nickel chelatase